MDYTRGKLNRVRGTCDIYNCEKKATRSVGWHKCCPQHVARFREADKERALEKELKRCPFCGGRAYFSHYTQHTIAVSCGSKRSCFVAPLTDYRRTASAAARLWNRRA